MLISKNAVDFIHFQETSPKTHVIKLGFLPFVTIDSGLPLQCLNLIIYTIAIGYSVVNTSYLRKESLKRGLLQQFDVLHTKNTKYVEILAIFAIFF